MDIHPILQFFISYGYWIAVPLMIVEGPIVTLVMGFLSSFGFFNLVVVISFSLVADLISDTFYYYSGYYGGPGVLKKIKVKQVHENGELTKLREQFEKHPFKIFFGAKVLTGVAHGTFVLAGVTQMSYKKILKYSIPGGIVWSSGLALLGYYFGSYSTSISLFLSRTGIAVFSIVVLFFFYKFWFGKFIAQKVHVWKKYILWFRNSHNSHTQKEADKPIKNEAKLHD